MNSIFVFLVLTSIARAQELEIFDPLKFSKRSNRINMTAIYKESKRVPSQYYDWDLFSGMIGQKSLNPDLTLDQIKGILGPHGLFKTEDSDVLFTFSDGGNIKISHQDGKVTNLNFLYGNYQKEDSVKSKFKDLLSTILVKKSVLKENPYYEEEVTVRNTLIQDKPNADAHRINMCNSFSSLNGVSFLPDQHGEIMPYDFVQDSLALKKVDWLGIEMIPHTLQGEVNDFINQSESSDKYKDARAKLSAYFSKHWNDKFKNGNQDGEMNPYFKLLETARSRKVQVYAMDVEPDYYASNPMMDPLVLGTRNLLWAKQLPTEGNGLVFGGSAHFSTPSKATVQDFYSRKAPSQSLTMFELAPACSLSSVQKNECHSDLVRFANHKKCEGMNEVRCLRRNIAFVNSACSEVLKSTKSIKENIKQMRATQ